jgi:hypothetical protein
MRESKSKRYTAREIGESLNNSVAKSFNPASLSHELKDSNRSNQLRAYGEALTKVCFKHVEQRYLKAEELVAILSGAALFVQLNYVMGTDKMPQALNAAAIVTAPEKKKRKKKGV